MNTAAESDPWIGADVCGRYLIDRPLGRGGMGCVYEAKDRQLGRSVALKFIRDELNDSVAQQRFMREARSAAALSHPNACRLYEVGEHEGRIFLVMELLEGDLLSERIATGPLPLEEAVAVLLPLMDAVSSLHGIGLIHRDLKPANVMISPQGVMMLDFGLARQSNRHDENAVTMPALTIAGSVAGTLRYMAPEQVTGDPVDERTDIFALGVMLYEMLTGRIPFKAETNVDWLRAVLNDDPEPLGPELQAVDAVVQRALQRRLVDRFASVAEMAATLTQAVAPAESPAAAAPEPGLRATIVVLPFRSLHEEEGTKFLCHGVPEHLTSALAGDPRWRLLSNRGALRFADTEDLAIIGRDLGADYLLTGTFMHSGDRVRVTTQLVVAADGAVTWSHAADFAFDDALNLQDAISRAITAGLAQHNAGVDGATPSPQPALA
ncbi:MAG: serine/threonine-protein kinase [Acidobacteriota bacterium]